MRQVSRREQQPAVKVVSGGETAALHGLSLERQELLCSLIDLAVKLGLVVVAGISLARLTSAYQERMERQGELAAVLELEQTKLLKARERLDQLLPLQHEQLVKAFPCPRRRARTRADQAAEGKGTL